VQDYIRRSTAKGLSVSGLSGLSDSEVKELLGKEKRKIAHSSPAIGYTQVNVGRQGKGSTLALWQEGIDKGAWHLGSLDQ
jgi:hypothetical protein